MSVYSHVVSAGENVFASAAHVEKVLVVSVSVLILPDKTQERHKEHFVKTNSIKERIR